MMANPHPQPLSLKEERGAAELMNWEVAHDWHSGVPLVYEGVNIGECMTYDVLRIIGRQWQVSLVQTEEAEPQAVEHG